MGKKGILCSTFNEVPNKCGKIFGCDKFFQMQKGVFIKSGVYLIVTPSLFLLLCGLSCNHWELKKNAKNLGKNEPHVWKKGYWTISNDFIFLQIHALMMRKNLSMVYFYFEVLTKYMYAKAEQISYMVRT
jgi:hypothetical protein